MVLDLVGIKSKVNLGNNGFILGHIICVRVVEDIIKEGVFLSGIGPPVIDSVKNVESESMTGVAEFTSFHFDRLNKKFVISNSFITSFVKINFLIDDFESYFFVFQIFFNIFFFSAIVTWTIFGFGGVICAFVELVEYVGRVLLIKRAVSCPLEVNVVIIEAELLSAATKGLPVIP